MGLTIFEESQPRHLSPGFIVVHENCTTFHFSSRALCERDLLKSVDHSETLLVFLGHYCVARPVDHQRLHARGNSSLNFLDIVTEEQNRLRRQLKHQASVQTTPFQFHKSLERIKSHLQLSRNLLITLPIPLQPGINSIKPTPRNQLRTRRRPVAAHHSSHMALIHLRRILQIPHVECVQVMIFAREKYGGGKGRGP